RPWPRRGRWAETLASTRATSTVRATSSPSALTTPTAKGARHDRPQPPPGRVGRRGGRHRHKGNLRHRGRSTNRGATVRPETLPHRMDRGRRMRIKDANPGDTVTITEGPAKGREVKIIAKGNGRLVAVHGGGQGQTVRRTTKLKPK